jgi:hypothetical protein
MAMVLSGDGTIAGLNPGGLPDASITYADIQSVAAGKVLGRDTSGAGVVQELPIAVDASGNVQISGNILLTDGTNANYIEVRNGSNWTGRLAASAVGNFSQQYYNGSSWVNGTTLDSSGNWKFNSGYGSVATAYGCRAWANFNGTNATVRGSGGVSSITQQSGISWDVAFASAMPDTNYSVCGSASDDGVNVQSFGESGSNNANRTTGKVRILLLAGLTRTSISLAVFR